MCPFVTDERERGESTMLMPVHMKYYEIQSGKITMLNKQL